MTRPAMWDDSPEACAFRLAELAAIRTPERAVLRARRKRPERQCSAVDCGRPVSSRDLCVAHYCRLKRITSAPDEPDQASVEDRQMTLDEVAVELRWLVEHGASIWDAAARLGYRDPASLARRFRRHDRPDLARLLLSAA